MSALPEHVVMLSFEGPDPYAMVGGLGVRATELSRALARAGCETQLFFIGDPKRPPSERDDAGVVLRRWSQWVSAYHPGGVYDGEQGKIDDLASSAPAVIASEIVAPANARGEQVLVLAEDWQTAPVTVALHRELQRRNLRTGATILWNANNTYGFDRIDWPALTQAAQITAVSKYMKFELALRDVASYVVPNGIPDDLCGRYDEEAVYDLQDALEGRSAFLKVGRYSPDKRWMQAIDAVAALHASGERVQLIVRGGNEPYGELIFARAREHGLRIADLEIADCTVSALARGIERCDAEIVNLRAFLPNGTLFALYGAVTAVLANSGKEPFGLVGLEVMAARGIPVCGSTGEDYARPFDNAIVVDSGDPHELAAYLRRIIHDDHLAGRIRKRARKTAQRYTWSAALDILSAKLAALA